MAQTQAVLKSTGGVAGVTADQVSKLAASLQKTTKFSDETIQTGENLLLTFTKIGKDIFPEATEIMLDMSQALGQDVKSSAIQLGKALQDPILGVTALRRVGVNFNEAQQDVIKNLVETGRSAEAQALIMKELKTEFGGSAEAAGKTFAGQLTIAKNTFSDFMELIGEGISNSLEPVIQAFNDWFTAMGGPQGVLNFFIEKLQQLQPHLPIIAGAIMGGLVPAVLALAAGFITLFAPLLPFIAAGALLAFGIQKLIEHFGGLDNTLKALQPIVDTIKAAFDLITFAVTNFLIPAVMQLWTAFSKDLLPALKQLWTLVAPTLIPILKFLAVVIGVVIFGAILLAIKQFTFMIKVISFVINMASKLIAFFKGIDSSIRNALKNVYNTLKAPFEKAFNWIKEQVGKVVETLKNLNPFSRHSPSLVDLISKGTDKITSLYGGMFDEINSISRDFTATVRPNFPGLAQSTNNNTANTTVLGDINIGSQVQADDFLRRFTRNQELANLGLTIKPK